MRRLLKSASRITPATAPGTRRARRRDSVATREALIAAGTELFAERGYDGVPVSAIAGKAGVNKAMINYHFGGKRKLYLAILTATFAEIVAGVERLAESTRPAPEVLRELVAMVGEVATRRHPALLHDDAARGASRAASTWSPRSWTSRCACSRRCSASWRAGVREGDFRPVDPLLTHLSLVGSLVFFFATRRFRERVFAKRRPELAPPDPDAFVKYIQELLTHAAWPRHGRTEDSAHEREPPPARHRHPSGLGTRGIRRLASRPRAVRGIAGRARGERADRG